MDYTVIAENIAHSIGTLLHYAFKILLGLLVVPLAIIFHLTWSWWQEKRGPIKWFLGIFYIPAAGFMYVVGGWWYDF